MFFLKSRTFSPTRTPRMSSTKAKVRRSPKSEGIALASHLACSMQTKSTCQSLVRSFQIQIVFLFLVYAFYACLDPTFPFFFISGDRSGKTEGGFMDGGDVSKVNFVESGTFRSQLG